jgi:HSP20 family protein
VENNVLTIRGEKREERTEGENGRFHLSERRYGTFSRSFVLPSSVDSDHIEAAFEDGVLRVTIPKAERARKRRIDVGGSNAENAQLGSRQRSGEGESSEGMR